MKQRSNFLTVLSRFFLAFLSSIFLFAFLILLTLRVTLFSENYIAKQAENANYYSELTKEINRQIENNALGSNIPQGVLDQVIDEKIVKQDVTAYFEAMYNKGIKYEISDENQLSNSVQKTVEQYAKEKNIELTTESEQAINQLAKKSVMIYQGYVELPFLVSYGRKVMNYKSKLVLFMVICGVLWGLLSLALFHSLRGYAHRLLRYWEYICVGSGLMMIVAPAIILQQGTFKRLGIQSKAMYDFIQTYLSSFLWLFIIIGIVTIIIGICFALLSEIKRKKIFSS